MRASEPTDLLGDKEMARRTVASCLTLSKFLWLFLQKGQGGHGGGVPVFVCGVKKIERAQQHTHQHDLAQ